MDTVENHIIKNFNTLASSPARTSLLAIAEAGYQAIRTKDVVRANVELSGSSLSIQGTTFDLSEYKNIYVLGIGKCAIDAAAELEEVLGSRITDGVIVDVRKTNTLTRIRAYEGTHPFPSNQNIDATGQLLALARKADMHDLVLGIVSGGGSTLLCQPTTHTGADEVELVQHLFKRGATITEINTIRKHLSKARGGFLAEAIHPATLVTLIFSDVPGDDIQTIASGPTIFDMTTLEDARMVFAKYDGAECGFSERHFFETPKDHFIFATVHNKLILTNKTALAAMAQRAMDLGYRAEIVDTTMEGEAHAVARMIVERLHESKPRTVLLYGGETTVVITGPGKGGRNEECAAAALSLLHDDELFVSLASDGRDNTEYAGAIADRHTREQARVRGLNSEDFLYTNDTFTFFHSLQQGIETGYTGANVADLMIAMKHENG